MICLNINVDKISLREPQSIYQPLTLDTIKMASNEDIFRTIFSLCFKPKLCGQSVNSHNIGHSLVSNLIRLSGAIFFLRNQIFSIKRTILHQDITCHKNLTKVIRAQVKKLQLSIFEKTTDTYQKRDQISRNVKSVGFRGAVVPNPDKVTELKVNERFQKSTSKELMNKSMNIII